MVKLRRGRTERAETMSRLSGSWPRRLGAALALLLAMTVVVWLILSSGSSTPSRAASNASSASGAVTVQRQDLVENDTESGTLSYANPQTVYNRLSGTITWLPHVGQVISPGQTLFKVDGSPVILMTGTTPAYRDLSPADTTGQDILQLNRNLVKLGFNPDGIVVDDTWQAATTAGVDVLQARLGETETGTLTLGQVVFLPGDQLVSSVEGALGSTGGGGGSGSPSSTSAGLDPARPTPEFVSLTTTSSTTHSPPSGGSGHHGSKPPTRQPSGSGSGRGPSHGGSIRSLEQLIALLEREIAQLKSGQGSPGSSGSRSPGRSSSSGSPSSPKSGAGSGAGAGSNPGAGSGTGGGSNPGGSSGAGGGNASAVLQTTSTQLVVTVDLDASKQSEAKVGEKVSVQMPAGNTANGRIIAVSPVAQSSSNSGNGGSSNSGAGSGGSGSTSATIPVTIALNGRQTGAGLDQAAVSVNFVKAVAKNVLSVPVTALLATPGGGYAVQEAAAPHKLIPVKTGLFAAGDVQISGSGVYPGLQVTASQG